jgi:tetratricopeptide (TPR) repeat protein
MERKLKHIKEAVAKEDRLIYMEPPLFYYQVKLSLGEALLSAGYHEAAEQAFSEALAEFPANGWALKGLHNSLVAQGKVDQAIKVEGEFEAAWQHADVKIEASVF